MISWYIYKVFINKNIPEAGLRLLQEKGIKLTINPTENILSREEFIKICQKNDVLLNVGTNKLDEDFFEQCPNLKGIALFSVGFDSVNIPSANSRKIPVGNTPDVLSRATSDVAFLLMQSVARKSFFNHKNHSKKLTVVLFCHRIKESPLLQELQKELYNPAQILQNA